MSWRNYTPAEPAHSPFGASSAKRYFECPASVAFQTQFPDSSSEFAERGTRAHLLGEKCLNGEYPEGASPWFVAEIEPENFEPMTQGDIVAVDIYVNHIREVLSRFKDCQGVEASCEAMITIDYAAIADPEMVQSLPEGFRNLKLYGSADFRITSPHALVIVDYKHGEGVYVDENDNYQMLFYGAGFWLSAGKPNVPVEMTIVQPRALESDNPIRTVTVSPSELQAFLDKLAKAVHRAILNPEEANPGDWCQFCRAAGSCKALAKPSADLIEAHYQVLEDFSVTQRLSPLTLSDEDLGEIVLKSDLIRKFLKAGQDELLRRFRLGTFKAPGLKVVETRPWRTWKETLTAKTLQSCVAGYGLDPENVLDVRILSPSQLEQVIRNSSIDTESKKELKTELAIRFMEKTSSGFKVVPEDAPGKAIEFTPMATGLENLEPPPIC